MLNRRHAIALLGATLTWPARAAAGTLPFYASAGRELAWYGFNEDSSVLAKVGSIQLPSNVQYAWPDTAGHGFLYVTASNNKPGGLGPRFRRPLRPGLSYRRGWRTDTAWSGRAAETPADP